MVFNLTHKAGLGDSDHICIYFVLNCYHEDKNTGQVRNCFKGDYLKTKLWRHYIRTRSNYVRTRFNTAKNELRSLTRNLRLKFESTIAENIKTSPKSFWSYVKSKTKTRCKILPLKKTDGTEAVTALEKAQILNTFFSSTFTEER